MSPGLVFSAPDSPIPIAYHKTTTEYRALARVPTRGSCAIFKNQPDRRQGARAMARRYRDS